MKDRGIYNDELLAAKRRLGDPPADEFIANIFENPSSKQQLQEWMSGKTAPGHLDSLKAAFPDYGFINQSGTLPPWAEPSLMKSGSIFFARHSEMIMSLLGLLSLPYCYTAANGAMVLYLSERIRKHTTKRLYDTAIFVWEVLGPDAFGKDGNAYEEILKVRIMHAAVRYYTFKSGKWDNSWGIPINQEDMAGTNLSFSIIVIRGLRLLGIDVSDSEQVAFMHTWAVIGHLTGLNNDLIPGNAEMAEQLDLAVKERQFCSSEHGKELTQSLIAHILEVNQSKATAHDILGLMRYLLGKEIADLLSIQAPALPRYKISLIKILSFFKGYKTRGDSVKNYQLAYAKFKKQSSAIIERS